jgi:transposase-like protein
MADSILSEPHFQDEDAAYEFVEARIWPSGPKCPHCGSTERIDKMGGKSTRIGTYKCYVCRKPFTVKIGTIFEDSHLPLRIWLQAIYLMVSSKKGISSNQLHRTLGCTLKTAWFLSHRIREAMREGGLAPFGATGGTVESDETFIGLEPGAEIRRGYAHKRKVLSLIDRDSKSSRSMVVDSVNAKTIVPILQENIVREARVVTDDAGQYHYLKDHFADHQVVCHSAGEYVSKEDRTVHVNCAENFFSVFKRGMKGIYQHCQKQHLHRYLAEFDFRYNHWCGKGTDDPERAEKVLDGAVGRRLTYETTRGKATPGAE